MNNPGPGYNAPRGNKPDSGKGSALDGFVLGVVLIIASTLCSAFFISLASDNKAGMASDTTGAIVMLSLFLPILTLITAILTFAIKRKDKIVYGILGAAALGMVALPILLVAACFGMFN